MPYIGDFRKDFDDAMQRYVYRQPGDVSPPPEPGQLEEDDGTKRQFATGATRDTAADKPAYSGFLSPLVIRRFGEYMLKHQVQSDGSLREPDNWQKGIPLDAYMDSLLRHVVDIWLWRRGYAELAREGAQDALCASLFNVQGMLHELMKEEHAIMFGDQEVDDDV